MTIDIICPLYNAEKYIEKLHSSLLMQKRVYINSINYILTRSSDNSEKILNKMGINYKLIDSKDFSHSLTRENAAKECDGDIIVFITQDVKIKRDDWLYYLTKDIAQNNCEAAYSRQLADKNNIEKYTREKNYPNVSFIRTKEDIKRMGLNTQCH